MRVRIQTRMVGEDGRVLEMTRFMDLVWDPADPIAIQLYDPSSDGTLIFARDLLAEVLREGTAGTGDIRLHITYQTSDFVVLQRPKASPLALKPKTAAAFLTRTYDDVPAGEEIGDVDLEWGLSELLRPAA
jgi:hypothetical protein